MVVLSPEIPPGGRRLSISYLGAVTAGDSSGSWLGLPKSVNTSRWHLLAGRRVSYCEGP